MKKIHIVAILMIVVAVVLLITASADMTTYSTFEDAVRTGQTVKVVGQLSKDKAMTYNPEKDPNYFSFYMVDDQSKERKVVLHSAKPQDFERSEQIVVTGHINGEEFIAENILMKCPSKYKEEEVFVKGKG